MKRILIGATLVVAGIAGVAGSPASAAEPVKVYVCKYTITPDNQEILQTGDNPIFVSENAIPGNQNVTPVKVGDRFNDAQGLSIVIQIGGTDPGVSACPGYVAPTTTTAASTTTAAPTTTGAPTTTTQVASAGPTTTAQVASAGPTTPPFQAAPVPTQLPSTGSSSWGLAMMALASLLGGVGLIKQARRPS